MESKLLRGIEPREYQKSIAETSLKNNTLVVLPTGIGKTLISVLVGIERLEKYPGSQIMITAPTRPLNAQHKKSFEKFTTISPEYIILVTGKIKPEEREQLYKKAKVVVATPQTIKNDVANGKLNLAEFSFITFDECHRTVKDYAYTYVAKKYKEQAKWPLILGLTASPGGSYEKIETIKNNLFIEAVEIRTELDEDVEPYVKQIEKDWVYVDFPEEFKKIKILLDESLKEDIYWLREHHYIQTYRPSKKILLALQDRAAARLMEGAKNYALMWLMIRTAEAIKIEHAIELLETQGITPLHSYFEKLSQSNKRTDKRLVSDPRIREAINAIKELHEKGVEHPKLIRLEGIVKDLVRENPQIKIIIFANFRSTVDKINQLLKADGIKSEILIGQATRERNGLTQEEQINVLKRFARNEFNVLIGTSISEEGLSIPAVDYVVFYESVPSEIRTIQRRGRTGRTAAGKAIFLITKDTRDEAYYWTAFHKERKMKGILYDMKNKKIEKKKENLTDWVK